MKKIVQMTFLAFVILAMTACQVSPTPIPAKPTSEPIQSPDDQAKITHSPTEAIPEPTQTEEPSEPEPTNPPEDPTVEPSETPATPETPKDPLSYLENVEEDPVGSRERVRTLKDTLENHLESWGYNFYFDAENVGYRLTFKMKKGFETSDLYVRLYYDMITVSAYPGDFTVPEESRDQMAYYATMANNDDYFYGFLVMDYETGDIFVRSTHVVEKVIPTEAEFEVLLNQALFILEDHSENIKAIALDGLDPFEAFSDYSD